MYTQYWKLRERPFDDSGDARFFYTTEAIAAATLKLRYAIGNRQYGIVLCGPSGVGKTAMLSRIQPTIGVITDTGTGEPVTATVPFPEMPVPELLAEIAWRIELASEPRHDESFSRVSEMEHAESAIACVDDAAVTPPVRRSVQRIERLLARNTSHGRTTVLVIEESHRLAPPVFETLRQILNLGTTPSSSVHSFTEKTMAGGGIFLILSGQPTLLPILARLPALEERLAGRALLPPLTVEETISYVSHRLHAAGAAENPFDTEAMETLHRVSGGIPRRINRIADMALLLGFAEELERPDTEHIQAIADDATLNPSATLPIVNE